MSHNILVAEDDEFMANMVKMYLESSGNTAFIADSAGKAIELFENNDIHCAVLDVVLHESSGYEVIKKIRESSNIPIIFLSGQTDLTDKIYGLNLGADDYITKPFEPLELIARVNSNIRRYYSLAQKQEGIDGAQIIKQGNLVINLADVRVLKDDEEVLLTNKEYKILLKMMKSPGRVFSKAQLYEDTNGEFFTSDENTIMVHISNLRAKIEDDVQNPKYIKTVRGIGYKFEKQD